MKFDLSLYDNYSNLLETDLKELSNLDKQIKHNPNNITLYLKKAHIYRDAHDDKKTILMYCEIFEKFPQFVEPYIELANLFKDYSQYEDAIKVAKEGLKKANNQELESILKYSQENIDL